ncbi:MAG: ATP-dependent RecD-like DNA helicase [Fibrobacter sp.]|jgi:exodeoxyribonuclease V alpha subunit|nr:ATP-dependent RecD-like DNA helicase [Fibrobacter sp.]
MEIEGVLKSVVYQNFENGFSVLRFEVSGEKQPVNVTGIFPEVSTGETFRLQGEWKLHPKYGKQFSSDSCEISRPSGASGILSYLTSGLFKGIGKVTAERLVDAFGENTLEVLDHSPGQIKNKVKGFAGKRLERFLESWRAAEESRETLLFLYSHQIHGNIAVRLWKHYGKMTVPTITENPYILSKEIWGIGFLKADEIAMKLGFSKEHELRIRSGILYTLLKASYDGHTYLPKLVLFENLMKILRFDPYDQDLCDKVLLCLKEVAETKLVIEKDGGFWLPDLYAAEDTIVRFIESKTFKTEENNTDVKNALQTFERENSISFAEAQFEGICKAAGSPLFIITGGPGTGKTTLLKGILHLARLGQKTVLLAAPTGRAARRMSEMGYQEASTLHRLLEINPVTYRFERNEENPLEADLVVIDEFSMVDTWLFAALIRALPPKAHLILIGDQDQLPSVGPGNVLRELLRYEPIPHIRLSHIFRQSDRSDIAEKASRINQGKLPSPIQGTHFHFREYENPEEAFQILEQILSKEIPEKISIEPLRDLQVLTPMHLGPLGTRKLNEFLQKQLNPQGENRTLFGNHYRKGDRMIQLKNNYEKNVFNGDIGFVAGTDSKDQTLKVYFDGRVLSYDEDDAAELTQAYACTIHKSQGSEYPVVIVVLDSSHFNMLQRNLIYTAVTRAKEHVWILSAPGAFNTAVRNNRTTARYTHLLKSLNEKQEFWDFLNQE